MRHSNRLRAGFTLAELVVAVVVIAILGAMTMIGLNAAQQSAKLAQTRGLVSRINEVIMNHWDDYHFRVLNASFDYSAIPVAAADVTPPQLLPEHAARARLCMLRDLMRMELPDRISDLYELNGSGLVRSNNTVIFAAGVIYEDNGGNLIEVSRQPYQISTGPRNPALENYQLQAEMTISQSINPATNQPRTINDWSPRFESAECLYLILNNLTLNGIPAMEMIAPFSVDDVDADGMNEIVDAWGNPIHFIRWPAGSNHPQVRRKTPDEFDLLSSDWGAMNAQVEAPYSIRPLIASPGPDSELGLITTLPANTVPYRRAPWPIAFTDRVIPNPIFIDPYLRYDQSGDVIPIEMRPGAEVSGQREFVVDNVTSFDL